MSEGKVFKWKCTVCGYIEEGVNPPEECPICGVGPEMFEKIEEEKTSNEEKSLNSKKSENLEKSEKLKLEETKGNTYIWKCTVCGYIEEGAQPPEKCPVCGVGPEYFVKLEETKEEKNQENDGISAKKENIVIIGASGAGMGACVEIRKRNKVSDITVLSKENVKGYFRPQLSKMLSDNSISIDSMSIKDDKWFKENNVKLMLNMVVDRIDAENKKVILTDGEELPYTKLIIASGAEVFVPPFTGRDKKGVFTLRYAKDGNDIKAYAKDKKTAAIIGGGVLGLEAASELNNLGLKVSIIEMADRILPRQLDKDASEILEEKVKVAGVIFIKGAGTKEIIGDEAVKGILLDNGDVVEAEIVIISTGVKANSKIAENTGIEIKRAIVVNEKMETNVSGIYACGDCAEYNGINYALWSEAIEQGKAAGINVSGGDYIYKTIIPSTTLNAFNSSVFSIGDIGSDPNSEYKTYEGNDKNKYVKLYFQNGVLAGGILIGDTSKTVDLIEGFEKSKTMEEMIEKFKA
ncbi:MAG TPA: FAD-dependent oxidoreductase [Sedimentibacter sp.]|nr:FAD-dependent oxidoreductase [Sedimentibacter sp.]HQC70231.1 FAD-dependent oxidoreductase [Sedimentibacter sp.]